MARYEPLGNPNDLPHGAMTVIAKRLRPRVTVQHVREVILGHRKSARVARAFYTYVRSLDRRAVPHDVAA